MVKRITDIKVGDPMGFKLLEADCNGLNTLDEVLDALKVYHGDSYIVGKDIDTGINKIPHYHIHWFSVKEVKEGALKTFRSSLGKRITTLSKGSRLYTGQDLPSGDKNSWLGYAIKETQVKVSGYSITDEILIASQTHKQLKNLKQVHSEKKTNEEKQKKQFKRQMLEYVSEELDRFEVPNQYMKDFACIGEYRKIRLLVIKYLKDSEREGSLKKGIIDTYVMYCCINILKWTEYEIEMNLYTR